MQWMILPLKRYVQFSGRSRRKEFWMFALLALIVYVVASILDGLIGFGSAQTYSGADGLYGASYSSWGPFEGIVTLGLLIPSLAVAVRRLHDTDRSGWWLLIGLIPLVGSIVLLVFYCLDGTKGENRFGIDPKGPDVVDVFG